MYSELHEKLYALKGRLAVLRKGGVAEIPGAEEQSAWLLDSLLEIYGALEQMSREVQAIKR